MRVIVVGASGTIGEAVSRALSARHEVVSVGRSHGEFKADITDKASLEHLFASLGRFDAIVSAAGSAAFKPLTELGDADFAMSLGDKLMGQVNLALLAAKNISDGGSITLTGGTLAREPMKGGAAVSLVNAALEGFGRAAAFEMPRGIRVNIVSPPWVSETLVKLGMKGAGLPADVVAKAYLQSIEGSGTGLVIDPRRVTS